MSLYKDRHLPTPPDPGLGAIRMRALRALGAIDRTRVQMSWREGRRQRADAERFAALREQLEMERAAA